MKIMAISQEMAGLECKYVITSIARFRPVRTVLLYHNIIKKEAIIWQIIRHFK